MCSAFFEWICICIYWCVYMSLSLDLGKLVPLSFNMGSLSPLNGEVNHNSSTLNHERRKQKCMLTSIKQFSGPEGFKIVYVLFCQYFFYLVS